MSDPSPEEIAWRKEFEEAGESAVRDSYNNLSGGLWASGEVKLRFLRKWLREKELKHEGREENTFWYTRWTFWAAISAIVVGLVGIAVTICKSCSW